MTEFSKTVMQLGILLFLMLIMLTLLEIAKIPTGITSFAYWSAFFLCNYASHKLVNVYNAIVYQVYLPQKPKTP